MTESARSALELDLSDTTSVVVTDPNPTAETRAAVATADVIPPCFKVGCDNDEKHSHVGPISKNERIVVTPKLDTAPGWAYSNPRGRYLGRDSLYAMVALDDGTTRRVSPQNVVRERLWKEPTLQRALPRPLHRPHKPMPEGPWVEEPLPVEDELRHAG